MRISVTTGLVVFVCLLGAAVGASAVWYEYQKLASAQQQTDQAMLAERDFRQMKTLINQFFVSLDLFFDGGQSYAAKSIERQSNELVVLANEISTLTGTQQDETREGLDTIRNIVAELAVLGPTHLSWNTGLEKVDQASLAIVERLELDTASNHDFLEASKLAQSAQQQVFSRVGQIALGAYFALVLLAWFWANRRIVGPLERLDEAASHQKQSADPAVFEQIGQLAGTREVRQLATSLAVAGRRIQHRQLTIEEQNSALAYQLEEIMRTRQKLIQAEKLASVGQLAAGVAHEINNPMSFVATNIETLEQNTKDITSTLLAYRDLAQQLAAQSPESAATEALNKLSETWRQKDLDFVLEDVADIFAECKDGTTRITTIVSQLSDFTDGAHAEERCDLNSLVQQSLRKIDNAGAVKLELANEVIALSQELRVSQAIRVLIDNALDACERQAEKVVVRTGCDAASV